MGNQYMIIWCGYTGRINALSSCFLCAFVIRCVCWGGGGGERIVDRESVRPSVCLSFCLSVCRHVCDSIRIMVCIVYRNICLLIIVLVYLCCILFQTLTTALASTALLTPCAATALTNSSVSAMLAMYPPLSTRKCDVQMKTSVAEQV